MMNGAAWQNAPDLLKLGLTLFTVSVFILVVLLWLTGWRWLAAAFAVIGILVIFGFTDASAHDHSRPELNDWLPTLHSKNKTWCCNGKDTDAIEDWDTAGGHYRVKFQGVWFDVPDDAVVDGPNKSGAPLLWMNRGYLGVSVRCFMPGSLT